jgi:hypothetical protein
MQQWQKRQPGLPPGLALLLLRAEALRAEAPLAEAPLQEACSDVLSDLPEQCRGKFGVLGGVLVRVVR